MKKALGRILKNIAILLFKTADKILPEPITPAPLISKQAVRTAPWFRDEGDKTHRLNYDLNEESIVMDLGGYEGQWAANIFCRYGCIIHIFEPYLPYSRNIRERFIKNKKVSVHDFGLSGSDYTEDLFISDDSSSTFKSSANAVKIQIKKIDDFFKRYNIEKVDLMKINIEGGEYDLLEHLIETGDVQKIHNIQVQFHDFVPDAEARMKAIQENLRKTHELTYQYEFVWENWKRKVG